MRVAIFTLTRDRLEYTQKCFQLLTDRAGYDYDHYIVDNGSSDGTPDWLIDHKDDFEQVILNSENVGIGIAGNQVLRTIQNSGQRYDLIAKFDNDCEVISEDIVSQMVDVYKSNKKMLLSPRVTGIVNQPKRGEVTRINRHMVSRTGHVGGLFTWFNANLYLDFRYPFGLPLGSGDDTALSVYAIKHDCLVGYVETLVIHHTDTTDGQAKKYPEYFKRKFTEAERGEKE